jgi:hypothetical protein
MMESLLQFIILFLSVYGLISLTAAVAGMVRRKAIDDRFKTGFALLVKDQEESIEGIVRTVFLEHLPERVMSKGKLYVVDMGSKDKTLDILSRLKEEYKCMDVLSTEQKHRIFEEYEQV